MEVMDTAIHTEFYWHINTEEGDEEVEYFRKCTQNMALTFATRHMDKNL